MSDEATARAIERVSFEADDPYADVDVSALPAWWRANLREFADHDLKTYLPSRFEDGAVVQREIERLEDAHGVAVRLVGVGVTHGDAWEVRVDEETVATVTKRRTSAGYTVFEVESDRFERLVREAADTGC